MDAEEHKGGLGQAVAEHVMGTVIIASAMAGVGALAGLRRGGSVKAEATLAGIMGTLGGLGFGRPVYRGIFGGLSAEPKSRASSWTDRVSQAKSDSNISR